MWLATFDNADELVEARQVIVEARLKEDVLDFTTQTWIGLANNVTGDKEWRWVIDAEPAVYTNWWQGNYIEDPEPNDNYRG